MDGTAQSPPNNLVAASRTAGSEATEAAVLLALLALADRPRHVTRRLRQALNIDHRYTWDALDALLVACNEGTSVPRHVRDLARRDAEHLVRRGQDAAMHVVPMTSERYPMLLRELVDPPPVLWIHGRTETIGMPAVAIVGARAASTAALETARRFAADLARAGLAVVSGLARGVDGAAHLGAIERGTTIAVLGGGLDRVYPAEHRLLAASIADQGAVVSEFAPGTPSRPPHFPQRNRIVAGLCVGVVVVEAGETSGSLSTARHALEAGREVMAVPGLALAGRNRGGHALIKDGAALVESAQDVLDVLRASSWRAHLPGVAERPEAAATPRGDGPPSEWRAGEELDLDELAGVCGASAPQLLGRLMQWELAGVVRRTPGGRFVRLDG